MTLSIIIPTIGRSTLPRTLESVVSQVREDDEVLVIGDGKQEGACAVAQSFGKNVRYCEHGPTRDFGHSQRNFAPGIAKGSYLAFMDDDDVYVDGAFDMIRQAAAEHPGKPLMFRMHFYDTVLWREPVLRHGNVSTQMFIVPNESVKLGTWSGAEDGYAGDLTFFETTMKLWPEGSLVWRPEIIARLTEHNFGK